MAGIFDSANLVAATNTTLRTISSNTIGSFSVNFCNRNDTSVSVRLAIAAVDTPVVAEWLLYDVIVPGDGSLERTGLVAPAGKKIVVYSSAANVSAQSYGYEE
jgi:hypothetical protein